MSKVNSWTLNAQGSSERTKEHFYENYHRDSSEALQRGGMRRTGMEDSPRKTLGELPAGAEHLLSHCQDKLDLATCHGADDFMGRDLLSKFWAFLYH